MFVALAPVQTDKTRESLVEVNRELHDVLGPRPVTAEELASAKGDMTLSLPGQWETSNSVASSIREMVQFNLPADYFDTYASRVDALTLNGVNAAAHEVVQPDHLVWVVVGDRAKIEDGIRSLNLGALHVIDADGNPVK